MKYKNLGNTREKISVLGLGTTGSGTYAENNVQKAENRIKIYRTAIDLGINFFDTSELYGGGYAEELLGKAIAGYREKILIASKFNPGNSSCAGILSAIEGTLRRIKVEYLDMYQVHWPNPDIPLAETLAALEKLVQQGKIRYIGVSNFTLPELQEAQSLLCSNKIATLEVEYNFRCREIENDCIPYCERHSISLLAYSPLIRGNLGWNERQKTVLNKIARKHEVEPAQVALSWVIAKGPAIALTRTDNVEHLKANVNAANVNLDDQDAKEINEHFQCEQYSVPADRISVSGIDTRPVYSSVEEAIRNKYDWIPSPEILSKNLLSRNAFKPINLVVNKTKSNVENCIYHIDSYDFIGELKKYWAWKIAYGDSKAIPASIREIEPST
jgi:diketogulonate reductase-like aldo/keto reductase